MVLSETYALMTMVIAQHTFQSGKVSFSLITFTPILNDAYNAHDHMSPGNCKLKQQ